MKKILTLSKKIFINWLKAIKYEFNSLLNSFDFWRKKRKANKLHKLTGKRYWIVPGTKNLLVVNNDFIKQYNRKCPKHKRIDHIKLNDMAYYCTGHSTHNERIRHKNNREKKIKKLG